LSTYLKEGRLDNLENLAKNAYRYIMAHDSKLLYIKKINPNEEDTNTSSRATLTKEKVIHPNEYKAQKVLHSLSNHNTLDCRSSI